MPPSSAISTTNELLNKGEKMNQVLRGTSLDFQLAKEAFLTDKTHSS